MNTNTFHNLSYGVYIISSLDGSRSTGCVANSVMQITSSPATIAVSINHDNFTNSCIETSGTFAISILSEASDPGLIGRFGFQSGREIDKFNGVDALQKGELSVIADACGYIVCKVINKMETSTHTIFLGEVIDADLLKPDSAMTYAYYHKIVKGKTPKNSPTYLPEETKKNGSAVSAVISMTVLLLLKNFPMSINVQYANNPKKNLQNSNLGDTNRLIESEKQL